MVQLCCLASWIQKYLVFWVNFCPPDCPPLTLPTAFFFTVMFSDVPEPKQTLLSVPGSDKPVFEREELNYSGCSECFRLGERSFSRQYAHIYATRLMHMRAILSQRAQQKWGETGVSVYICVSYS